MKTNDILKESLEDQLAQAEKHVLTTKRTLDQPGSNWQDSDNLRDAHTKVKKIKLAMDQQSGKVKTIHFVVPEERATQLHAELHELWQGTGVHNLPWQMYIHPESDKTIVTFQDYTPGEKQGSAPVEDLIELVASKGQVFDRGDHI